MYRCFYKIESEKIKENKKFLMISDIHNKFDEELLKTFKQENPDMIFVVGDIVDRHKKSSDIALPILKALCDMAPTFFSFGNHEIKMGFTDREKIEKTGAFLLDNEFLNEQNFSIGGYTGTQKEDWIDDFERQNGYKILLCHHPELYKKFLKDKKIDLIFAGHAHGGQWRIFDKGIFAPEQGIFPKYTHGIYDNKMIVSCGATNPRSIPRINNPVEYVVVEISAKI